MRLRRLLIPVGGLCVVVGAEEPSLAFPLLDGARRQAIPVCIDDREGGVYGYYAYHFGIIVLKGHMDFQQSNAILVHELRHVDLVSRGFRSIPGDCSLDPWSRVGNELPSSASGVR